jgi:alpha/beta superfamily hydrolase
MATTPSDTVAVILHPHPQYGGDMDNHVVLALAEVFREAGASTLRYNSRGTGDSGGAFDGRGAEVDDCLAAVAFAGAEAGASRVVLAGYSFGAIVAAMASERASPVAIVLVSPPGRASVRLPADVRALLVTGERDGIAPPDGLTAIATSPLHETAVVPGADHGWWPGVRELQALMAGFAARVLIST